MQATGEGDADDRGDQDLHGEEDADQRGAKAELARPGAVRERNGAEAQAIHQREADEARHDAHAGSPVDGEQAFLSSRIPLAFIDYARIVGLSGQASMAAP